MISALKIDTVKTKFTSGLYYVPLTAHYYFDTVTAAISIRVYTAYENDCVVIVSSSAGAEIQISVGELQTETWSIYHHFYMFTRPTENHIILYRVCLSL